LTSPREETLKDRKSEDIKGLVFKFRLIRWILFTIMGFCLGVIFIMPKISSHESRISSGFAWVILILSIFLWYGSHCLKFVRAWENGVIFRFGDLRVMGKSEKYASSKKFKKIIRKFSGRTGERARKPGPTWIWYGLDKIVFVRADQQEGAPLSLTVFCADNFDVTVPVFFVYRVTDAASFLVNVTKPVDQLTKMVEAGMRGFIGKNQFDIIRGKKDVTKKDERDDFIAALVGEINKQINPSDEGSGEGRNWGIELIQVRILDVNLDPKMQEKIENVAKAEKDKEVVKINAEAKKAEIETLAEAEKTKVQKAAEAKRFELEQQAEGMGAFIAKQGEAYNKPGGERVFGAKVSETIKSADKTFVINLGDNKVEGVIGAAIGALAGGFSKKPTI